MGRNLSRFVRRSVPVVMAFALITAACGSDDSGDDGGDTTAATAEATSTTAGGDTTEAPATTGGSTSETTEAETTAPETSEQPVVTESRGYDGETLKVAGIGSAANFADADLGAKARFERANSTGELPYKIEYLEFADDKQDPATATSEVRRLVTQEKVFAIVPDLSAVNPGPYLNEQHVPYVGYAFDNTYCSPEPVDTLYGFGYSGCLVPAEPKLFADQYANLYKYVSEKTGKASPTIALFSNDNQSGKNSARFAASAAQGAGFEVVYAKGTVPTTTSDYSPYVQDWLSAADGEQPDAMYCLMAVQCIAIWGAVKAAGYTGTFQTSLYTDLLLEPLAGTVALAGYNPEPNDGLTQMLADLEAVKSGTQLTSLNAATYFAADMFIQALKTVGTNVTPEAVQEALAHQTWQIEGFAGPTRYPDATAKPTPYCATLLEDADGTAWKVLVPFTCTEKSYPIDPKFEG